MERALKERIIGAIVLVAVVVLVVPVFLDGPPENDEIVSERVLLPGQDEQPSQTIVLERNRTEPVPAQTTDAAAEAAADARPEPARAESESVEVQQVAVAKETPPATTEAPIAITDEPKAEPEPQTASTTGMWAVQLGSFSNQKNADQLAADLRKQGYAAFLSQLDTASGPLHRVRVGPQKDRAAAEAVAARLKKAGHDSKVLPHP